MSLGILIVSGAAPCSKKHVEPLSIDLLKAALSNEPLLTWISCSTHERAYNMVKELAPEIVLIVSPANCVGCGLSTLRSCMNASWSPTYWINYDGTSAESVRSFFRMGAFDVVHSTVLTDEIDLRKLVE